MVSGHMVKDHSDHCRHMGYSFRLAARVCLYVPSHRQDSTYHSLCYTSCGALAGTRNRKERKEGNVLFNEPLKTFCLQLYGVGYMVKDYSDSKIENPLLPHGLLFLIWGWGRTSNMLIFTEGSGMSTMRPVYSPGAGF